MSSLRSSLIRLAHQRPSLRPHLLPILKSAALPPAQTWLEMQLGKVFHSEAAGHGFWFVPQVPTKSGTAKGLLVRWVYAEERKPQKAKQSSISERDLSSTHWKPVTAKDIPAEVLARFQDAGVRVASVREARVTQELIRVKYVNLGDFGGTDPVEDSWVLDVAGPTFDYRDELKRLGFRWNSTSKVWSIDATLYKYGGRRNAEFYKNRKLQEAAFPVVQALAKKHNEAAEAFNRGLRPGGGVDNREVIEHWQRLERMQPKLEAAGLKVEHTYPGRYDVTEGTVTVSGNTYPFVAIMKRHGWKWNPSKKAWEIPVPEYHAIQDKWMGDIVRELPSQPAPVVSAVFSEMSPREIADWVRDHYDYEDLTNDGEQDIKVGIARYTNYLKTLSPEDQQRVYTRRNR